jgi:hypothetical protein
MSMCHLTVFTIFKRVCYLLIILFGFNNVACTNIGNLEPVPQKIQPVQSEQLVPPLETKKMESKTTLNELVWAQLNLDALGYKVDNFEGQLTQATREALVGFQSKVGLSVTGTLNPTTFQALEQMVQNQRLSPQPGGSQRLPSVKNERKLEKPSVATEQNKPITPPKVKSFTDIQTVGTYKVAAYLAQKGYFREPLKLATPEKVEIALKLFQQDIGVTPTGFLDEVTLKKLQSTQLNSTRKAELEAMTVGGYQENAIATAPDPSPIQKPVPLITQPKIESNKPVVTQQPKPVAKPSSQQSQATVSAVQKTEKPGDPVKPTTSSGAINTGGNQGSATVTTPTQIAVQKPISSDINSDGQVMAHEPALVVKPEPPQTQVVAAASTAQTIKNPATQIMPTSSILKNGELVYALDRIECKGDHEAFVLFYQGQLEQIQKDKVQVRISKRYAMWYDFHKEGVSTTDWWCIPKKRFCYSTINFTDWRGKLKPGSVGDFQEKWTIPSHFDITALVAKSSKRVCSF